MLIKFALTLLFLVVMVGVGVYSRRHSGSVDGFVLGGRNVGPWLTAFVIFLCLHKALKEAGKFA